MKGEPSAQGQPKNLGDLKPSLHVRAHVHMERDEMSRRHERHEKKKEKKVCAGGSQKGNQMKGPERDKAKPH